MKILLTNDDGYKAKGIRVLKEVLKKYNYETIIVAPFDQQSAKSMSISITWNAEVKKVEDDIYYVKGTPCDAVTYAYFKVASDFDLCISGINNGYNCSTDILYSGTLGAAKQAALFHLKAIALSAEDDDEETYRKLAEFVARNIEVLSKAAHKECVVSLNIPNSQIKGYRLAKSAKLVYERNEEKEITRAIQSIDEDDNFEVDYDIVQNGYISISAIKVSPVLDSLGMKILQECQLK